MRAILPLNLHKAVTIAYFLLLIVSGGAKSTEITDSQTWWIATASGSVYKNNEKTDIRYWLEAQDRLGDRDKGSSLSFFRPGLGYALNDSTSLWIGYAWFYTPAPINQRPVREQRVWEQLLWTKNYNNRILSSRTRLEQRTLSTNPRTGWRVRELLKLAAPIFNNPKLTIIGSDEVFWHVANFSGQNNKGFDQNRFFIGVGYKINPTLSTEIGYLSQFIHRPKDYNLLAHVASTTLVLNLDG